MLRFRPMCRCALGASLALTIVVACSSEDDAEEVALSPELQAAYERQRPAAELAAQASVDFEGYVTSRLADPLGALKASLEAKPNVSTVTALDVSGAVIGRLENGVAFNVLTTDKSRKDWTSPSETPSSSAPRTLRPLEAGSAIQCDPKSFPQSKKACIVSGFTASFGQDLGPVRGALGRAGFAVTEFALKTPDDLRALRDALGTCGVLYISSHGSVAKNISDTFGNHVVTEIPFSPSALGGLAKALGPQTIDQAGICGLPPEAKDPKSYYSLSPEFFASATYPNTMVFVDACSSDEPVSGLASAGGSSLQLRDAFRKNGAGAFIGWEAPVSARLSNPVTQQLFEGLAPKVATIDAVRLGIAPPRPGPGDSYVPSATISPPQAGVEVRLAVRGTDKFRRDETKTTDASGQATFTFIPGAQGGVVDTVTLSAGGADDSATAIEVVKTNPTLESYRLAWLKGETGAARLRLDANEAFNLVCANQKLTQTESVVKF